MSFSVQFSGTAAEVKDQIASEEARLGGDSQKEFRDVRGALDTLVGFNTDNRVTLIASGHGNYLNGVRQSGNVNVELRPAQGDEGMQAKPEPLHEGDGGQAKTAREMPAHATGRRK